MKRNGTEYIEQGLAGHPRKIEGLGLSVKGACNEWLARRGLPVHEHGVTGAAVLRDKGISKAREDTATRRARRSAGTEERE